MHTDDPLTTWRKESVFWLEREDLSRLNSNNIVCALLLSYPFSSINSVYAVYSRLTNTPIDSLVIEQMLQYHGLDTSKENPRLYSKSEAMKIVDNMIVFLVNQPEVMIELV